MGANARTKQKSTLPALRVIAQVLNTGYSCRGNFFFLSLRENGYFRRAAEVKIFRGRVK